MDQPPLEQPHVSDNQVASYIRRTLQEAERELVVQHLAECAACRSEALAAARTLRERRARRGRNIGGSAAVVAMAAAAIFLWNPAASDDSAGPQLLEGRPAAVGDRTAIEVVAPSDSVPPGPVTFTWKSVGADVPYRFSLTRSDGSEVWSTGTPDTVLTLPADVSLTSGETYFWYVDALLLDGESVTTGIRPVTVLPR